MNTKPIKIILLIVLLIIVCAAIAVAAMLKPLPARPAIGEALTTSNSDYSVEYYRSGDGPNLILLPSFSRTASDFNELANALNNAGYRTLAIQPGGIGESDWPGLNVKLDHYANAVQNVIAAENINHDVVVIGHAFGNRIARSFASLYPQHTRALILLAAGGREATSPEVGKAIQTTLFGFSDTARRDAVQSAFFADANTAPDYWVNGWYPIAGLAQANATATTDFANWGHGGTSPMLVLQSLQDKAAPPKEAGLQLLADHPDRVTYQSIDNAGHAFLPEQPKWLLEQILAYLKTLNY